MHEMLGNQYFMVRNFSEAANQFEIAVKEHPDNYKIKKKLIVSYTQIGKVGNALELFYNLIQKDINIIFNTDIINDDSPCPELIPLIQNKEKLNENSSDYYIILAILWSFCDKYKSLEYFNKANNLSPNNNILKSILNTFNDHLNNIEFAH